MKGIAIEADELEALCPLFLEANLSEAKKTWHHGKKWLAINIGKPVL